MAPRGEHHDPRWSALPSAAPADAPVAAPGSVAPAARARLWWEITAVACIAVFPPLANALTSGPAPEAPRWDSAAMAWHVAQSVCVVVPLLWIARRGGMEWRELGLVRPRAVDLLSVALLTLLSIGIGKLAWIAFMGVTGDDPERIAPRTEAIAPVALFVVAHLANGFAEEVAMRGYLIPRLRAATGSLAAAITLSTSAFASYHGYQGAYGVAGTLLFGLVYAFAFLMWRNVGVLALAHALSNLWTAYVAHR